MVKGAEVPRLNGDDFHNFKIGTANEDDMPHNVLFSRNASNLGIMAEVVRSFIFT